MQDKDSGLSEVHEQSAAAAGACERGSEGVGYSRSTVVRGRAGAVLTAWVLVAVVVILYGVTALKLMGAMQRVSG